MITAENTILADTYKNNNNTKKTIITKNHINQLCHHTNLLIFVLINPICDRQSTKHVNCIKCIVCIVYVCYYKM